MALNLGGRGVLILLSLASTPVLLHRLGTEAYGVYVLALTLGGLLGLLDLGLTPALVMLLSRSWHRGAHAEAQHVVSTAFTLFLAIGILGGIALALLVPWMVTGLLNVPLELQDEARFALWLSTGAFVLTMWLSVYNAIPVALERYDLIAARMVGLSLLTTVALIAYALLVGDLRGLILINVLGTVAGLVVFYIVSRTILPGVHLRPGLDRASLRALARFGAFKFAGSLGNVLTYRFDQMAIGAMLGVQAVSFYAVPSNATSRVFALLTELVAPIFPRASRLKGDREAIRALFLRGTRLMVLASFLTLGVLFVFADHVLLYWIGGDQGQTVARESTTTMRWLLAALMVQALAAIPYIFCEALGKPEINNGFAVVSSVIHVPLVLLLVPSLGIAGAAVALFLNSATQTVVFIIYAGRRLVDVGAWELFAGAVARPLAATLAAALVGVLAQPFVRDLFSLLLAVALMSLSYLVAALTLSAITRQDLSHLGRLADRLPLWFPGRKSILRWRHQHETR